MKFFPSVVNAMGASIPLPFCAWADSNQVGLSQYNNNENRHFLVRKGKYARGILYGAIEGLIERFLLTSIPLGHLDTESGINYDRRAYNNVLSGKTLWDDWNLDLTVSGGLWDFSSLRCVKSYNDRVAMSDSLRNMNRTVYKILSGLGFTSLLYDMTSGGHLVEGTPKAGHIADIRESLAFNSPVVPDDQTSGDTHLEGLFASNVCIPSPGYVQDLETYKTNPGLPFQVLPSAFDPQDLKWAWSCDYGDEYPVSELEKFVRKLPISFGDIDYVCAGGETGYEERERRLSPFAASVVIPAISTGFARALDANHSQCPLAFHCYGDAQILLGKTSEGVGRTGLDRTIERLLGNGSRSTSFMGDVQKLSYWPFHLVDAAVLGPTQNRMIRVDDFIEVAHKTFSLSHIVDVKTDPDVDMSDSDEMLRMFLEGGGARDPIDVPVSLSHRYEFADEDSFEYDIAEFSHRDDHSLGVLDSEEVGISFVSGITIRISAELDMHATFPYYVKRRSRKRIIEEGVEVDVVGYTYLLSAWDLWQSGMVRFIGVPDGGSPFIVGRTTFTQEKRGLSTSASHRQEIKIPYGGEDGTHPASSLNEDEPITFPCYTARAICGAVSPFVQFNGYCSGLKYGGDEYSADCGGVMVGNTVDPETSPRAIGESFMDEGRSGWVHDLSKDIYHKNVHRAFAECVNNVLFSDDTMAPVIGKFLEGLKTEHRGRPTLGDIADDPEKFLRDRDADLMNASLAESMLTATKTYTLAAEIFIPDHQNYWDYATIKLGPAFEGCITDPRYTVGTDVSARTWSEGIGDDIGYTEENEICALLFELGDVNNGGRHLSFGWKYRQAGNVGGSLSFMGYRAVLPFNFGVHDRDGVTWPNIL